MPQFDFTTYSSQIFWFILCFFALYLTMHFVVLPRILKIISERKDVIDSDLASAKKLDDEINEIQEKTNILRLQATKAYQLQIEESTKIATRERDKSLEELKDKIDEITKKSRQEIKNFLEKSQEKSQTAAQNLTQAIKSKIFS